VQRRGGNVEAVIGYAPVKTVRVMIGCL
jgi:hypothetical protein